MKRRITSFVVLALLSVTLFSCGTIDIEGNGEIYTDDNWQVYESGHQVKGKTEINFWSANSAVDLHGSVMADMVEDFNKYQKQTYPNSYIKVNPSFQGGYANQNSKLQASLMGNTNPEIAMVGVSSMALYNDNALDMRNIFTYDEIRNIHEGFLQFAMYKHKFVSYPYFASTNVYVVNRTLSEKTGLAIPSVEDIIKDPNNSTWTWELFEEYVKKARTKVDDKEIYGASITGIPLYEALYTQGAPVYDETATKSLFNNEKGQKAFDYWQKLVKNDYVLNPVLDPNHGTKQQGQFAAGNVGMLMTTSAVLKSLYKIVVEDYVSQGKEPAFELDVLPHPKDSHFYSNQSGGGLLIFNNKTDEKTKAAVEFLRWLQADEQSVRFSTSTGYLATTKTATNTEAWKEFSKKNPLLDDTIKLMRFVPAEGLKLPIGRAKSLADTDFMAYAKGVFLDNCTRDIQAVLKECADRVDYILETNR